MDGPITEDAKVAEELNKFFISKVENLKNSIDKTSLEDPLIKLKIDHYLLFSVLVYKKFTLREYTIYLLT